MIRRCVVYSLRRNYDPLVSFLVQGIEMGYVTIMRGLFRFSRSGFIDRVGWAVAGCCKALFVSFILLFLVALVLCCECVIGKTQIGGKASVLSLPSRWIHFPAVSSQKRRVLMTQFTCAISECRSMAIGFA